MSTSLAIPTFIRNRRPALDELIVAANEMADLLSWKDGLVSHCACGRAYSHTATCPVLRYRLAAAQVEEAVR